MVIPILNRKSVRLKDCNTQNLVNGGVRILSTGGLIFLISKGLYQDGESYTTVAMTAILPWANIM